MVKRQNQIKENKRIPVYKNKDYLSNALRDQMHVNKMKNIKHM